MLISTSDRANQEFAAAVIGVVGFRGRVGRASIMQRESLEKPIVTILIRTSRPIASALVIGVFLGRPLRRFRPYTALRQVTAFRKPDALAPRRL